MTDRPAPGESSSARESPPPARGPPSASREQTSSPPEDDARSAGTHVLERRVTSTEWLARAAGIGLSGVSVGFVLVFLLVLGRGGELALVTRPLPMQVALAIPYLIVLLAVGTTVGAVLAWTNRYWSLSARIHQTVLAVLGVLFVWQLATLGFVGL